MPTAIGGGGSNYTRLAAAAAVAGWPDASNTGPTGTLTSTSHGTISTDGTIIQNESFAGGFSVTGNNVTIRNCAINGGFFCIDVYGNNFLLEDCLITGAVNGGILWEDGCSGGTVRRCEFTACEDGMKGAGSFITIEDNWFHDPTIQAEAHNDGFQLQGMDHVTIRHNYMYWADTSCISMFQGQGVYDNVTIQNNYLKLQMPGGGYVLYCGGTDGTNIKVLDNVFGNLGGFGAVTDWNPSGTGNVWSGNTLESDGSTVNP